MSIFDVFRRWRQSDTRSEESAAVTGEYSGDDRRGAARCNARAGTRILLVDDSPTVLAQLRKMLGRADYVLAEADSAKDAFARIKDFEPELIFLDIVLPDQDGFAVLRTLRRDPATRDVPIIMISGNEQATEQFYVQRIGADDFMKKPFSRSELFSRIEALLDAERVPRRTGQRIGIPLELA